MVFSAVSFLSVGQRIGQINPKIMVPGRSISHDTTKCGAEGW